MTPRTAQGPVANPIADCLAGGTVGPSTLNLVKAVEDWSAVGDSAVPADVPADIAVQDYLPWLESFEPAPALNLCSGSSAAHPRARVETALERRTVLDNTASELPAVGPDTRYMAPIMRLASRSCPTTPSSGRIAGDTVGMNMNQGDVPAPPLRECHLVAYDRGTANPQPGN